MFDQFKALGQVAGLLKDRERLKAAGERVRQRLDEHRCEGEAGGGAVRAVVTASMRVVSLEVQPVVFSGAASGGPADHEAAQAMIAEALNAALEKAQAEAKDILTEEARTLGLPDLGGGGLGNLLP